MKRCMSKMKLQGFGTVAFCAALSSCGDGQRFGRFDAGTDAGPPPTTDYLYYWGDVSADNVFEVGRYAIATGAPETLAPDGLLNAREISAVDVSEDGSKMAIAGIPSGSTNTVINVYAADGTGTPVTVFTSPVPDVSVEKVAFSPDGLRLAFLGAFETSGGHSTEDVALFVAPSSAVNPAIRVSQDAPGGDRDVSEFRWIDDRFLAFVGDMAADGEVSAYSVEVTVPGTPRELIPASERAMFTATQAVEAGRIGLDASNRIYFLADYVNLDGEFHLYRNDRFGTDFEEVPGTALIRDGRDPASIGTFGLAPDGMTLAFTSNTTFEEIEEVFVMALSGATPRRVDSVAVFTSVFDQGPESTRALQFSPDGSRLAFAADWTLGALDADDSFAVYLLPTRPTGSRRLFGFSENSLADASEVLWAPDGNSVFARADYAAEGEHGLFQSISLLVSDQSLASTSKLAPVAGGGLAGLVVAALPSTTP